MKRWLPAVGGLGAFFFWWYARQIPWPLALLIAIAVGALLFTALGAFERLRRLIEQAPRVEPSPWNEHHRQDQQQVRPASEDAADE